jgi:hypothetical protein
MEEAEETEENLPSLCELRRTRRGNRFVLNSLTNYLLRKAEMKRRVKCGVRVAVFAFAFVTAEDHGELHREPQRKGVRM